MRSTIPRPLIEIAYYDAAQRYLRSLPPEHFMEALPQGTQRKITLASLELVHTRRPEIQVFNELLLQQRREEDDYMVQVVPDNMVVVWKEPLQVETSYDIPMQPAKPLLALEYVSKNSKRKDYDENFDIYEQELKIPYLLLFYPEKQDLRLHRHRNKKYALIKPNAKGRLAIPELELEVAILERWVRFWFRGEMLPLPGDLLLELDEVKRDLASEKERADRETERAQKLQLEVERLRAQLKQQNEQSG